MKKFIRRLLSEKSNSRLIEDGTAGRMSVIYPFSRFGYDFDTAWLLSDTDNVVTIRKTEGELTYCISLHSCSVENLDFTNPLIKCDSLLSLRESESIVIALLNFDVPKHIKLHFKNATINDKGLISAPVEGKEYSLMWAQSDSSLELLNTTSQFEINPNYSYNIERFSDGIVFYGILDTKLINVGSILRRDTEMSEFDFNKITREAATFTQIVSACSVVPGMKVSANGFVYYAARLTKSSVECLDADDLDYIYFDRDSNKMAVLENIIETL